MSDDTTLSADATAPPAHERGRITSSNAPPRGAELGRFVVLGTLGSGGMGIVLAAYDPTLDRRVALKLLWGDLLGGASERARLVKEAQAMARVAHPNIVAVHEVGLIGQSPFVVMEHVDGGTLRGWMKAPRSPVEIVAAFVEAGRGLAAAHAVGVVHRDFKPDNVLVGTDGRVRVSDFGLASAAAVSIARGGTPAYMAPEQARNERVDARADQFSFCVALAEALTGSHPLRAPDQARREVPAWCRAAIARGMAPDPAARWPSMDALLAALAPPRSRRGAIALAGAAVAVVGAIAWASTASPSPSSLCQGAAAQLDDVWTPAVRQRVRAAFRATGRPYADDTLARVDGALAAQRRAWIGAHTEACRATRVRGEQSEALLDLRVQCLGRIERQLRAFVELLGAGPDTDVLDRAVSAAAALGSVDACADTEALTLRPPPPREPVAALHVATLQARADQLRVFAEEGLHATGVPMARALIAEARATGYAPLLADVALPAARLEYLAGHTEPAIGLVHDAIRAAAAARDDVAVVHALRFLLFMLGEERRLPEATALMPVADAAVARAGDPPLLRAEIAQVEANVLLRLERVDEAVPLAEEAVRLFERRHGPSHPDVAAALIQLAEAYDIRWRSADAIAIYRRVLAISEATYGPVHPRVATAHDNLGTTLENAGDSEQAEQILRRALAMREAIFGPDHRSVGTTLYNLGTILEHVGRNAEARVVLERSVRIKETQLGPDHPTLGGPLSYLGTIALDDGRLADAVALFERSLAIKTKAFGADHAQLSAVLCELAEARRRSGRVVEARSLLERAVSNAVHTQGADGRQVARSEAKLGTFFVNQHQCALAIPHLTHAIALWDQGKEAAQGAGKSQVATIPALVGLGECLSPRDPAARAALARAVAIAEEHHLVDHDAGIARFALARTVWRTDPTRALGLATLARGQIREASDLRAVDAWLAAHQRELVSAAGPGVASPPR